MPDLPEVYSVHVDAGTGAHQRAVLEAALPGLLAGMFPAWLIWGAADGWYACRRDNLRRDLVLGPDNPAALWVALAVEKTDKGHILPMVADAGERHHRSEVPFRLPRRVHTQGNRRRDGTSAESHLRLIQ